ncbi:MAG TPA: PAAR domain-containing protein [Steroidobacteraceae bacterium]|nr:PAAR domain-containing protein [Steroidobacteraceae bacterium]
MREAAAKKGDQVLAVDTHLVLVGSSVVPLPFLFSGVIDRDLSANVNIMSQPAAVFGSGAYNHIEHRAPPGQSFQNPPTNLARIVAGSATVNINGVPAARNGDVAATCNDPNPLPIGTVAALGTVFIG